jgi:hypothetical protein
MRPAWASACQCAVTASTCRPLNERGSSLKRLGCWRRNDAYFSDRSQPFQADRSRRFNVIVAEEGARA